MTNLDAQTLVALVCVVVALTVLCRRTLLWWRGQSAGCGGGGCHGCGETTPAVPVKVPLAVIELPNRTATVREQPDPVREGPLPDGRGTAT